MHSMHHEVGPSDGEIAAALIAVRYYVEQHALGGPVARSESVAPPARPWSTAAALSAQGMPPTRGGAHRSWGAVERAGRAGCWSYGITGL
ncbi:MAG TPA: hypothetical protein VFO07_00920 [Roseiflexaceae bacterium]|nr:hypothetical protein [Roseiflexaceae bacterium]